MCFAVPYTRRTRIGGTYRYKYDYRNQITKNKNLANYFNIKYNNYRKYLPVTKSFNAAKRDTLRQSYFSGGRILVKKWKGTREVI